jgi:rhamnosyltransferase subunit B
MNVLLHPVGSHGDVHPFIGLGIELLRRNHRVTVITNEHFGPLARSAGLNFAPVGDDAMYRSLMRETDLWHPTKGPTFVLKKGVRPLLAAACEAIGRHYVPGETVVVGSSLGMAARIFQDATGAPTATVHLSPICFRSDHDPPTYSGVWMPKSALARRALLWFADHVVVDPTIAPAINRIRAGVGLPKVRRILKDWWNSPARVIGMFPQWFAPAQTDWPTQTVLTGFPLYDERDTTPISPELERFLNAGDAPIAFTPGSAMLHGHEFFKTACTACAKLGRRAILLTRHKEQVPATLPPDVIHVDYAPFGALLPRCSAVVHHGGIGTAAQGLSAGIPHLVMPMSHDQPDNASRLDRLGVGITVNPQMFEVVNVYDALLKLESDPNYVRKAREISEKMKSDHGLERTADLVEELI